jgi:hypothetical protein
LHKRGYAIDQSLLAAIARFPDCEHAIEEFDGTDESFLSLCADLADAEAVSDGGSARSCR